MTTPSIRACLRCPTPMQPAMIRQVRMFIQPESTAWFSPKASRLKFWVCPKCGYVEQTVEDRSLFQPSKR